MRYRETENLVRARRQRIFKVFGMVVGLFLALAFPFALIMNVTNTQPERSSFVDPIDGTIHAAIEVRAYESVDDVALTLTPNADIFRGNVDREDVSPKETEVFSELVLPNAHASILLDADTGTILHYSDGKQRRSIASLTKLMTVTLVVEHVSQLDEVVTITPEMLDADGTVIGCPRTGYCNSNRLRVGETITVRNLLHAVLMNSANDAAHALGVHVGGSLDNFVALMNERARQMGLNDTNFCTPSGLEIDGKEHTCYSTAYDIARIAMHALEFDVIWDILMTPTPKSITDTTKTITHELIQTNQLLGEYSPMVGVKTGYTPNAGYSLLAVAKNPQNGHKVVGVLLDDPYRWEDIKTLFEWSFRSYVW